ncbi:MAG: hypothetical protein WCK49_05730 [Myxococcaceae bacterium]
MQILWLATFLFALSSQATMGIVHDIPTMTRNSGVVIQAKVISQKVEQEPGGRIVTLTTLQVKDGMKGAKTGQEITLYQVGGEYRGRVMRLQGASVYKLGEEVMLFGVPYRDQIVSYGLGLGKFNIIKDQNEIRVTEDIHDIEVATRKSGRQFFMQAQPREYKSLKAFKEEIRKAL